MPTAAATPFYLRVLLDRNQGIVLEVLDALGQNQQSVTLDGTTLTLKVQGPAGQSTLVQTAERIALTAKDVSIDADTVRITSRGSTTMQSLGQTQVSSAADITIQTPGRISQHCATGLDVNTKAMAISAMQNVSIQALGGIGLLGVSGGVQVYGNTINLTGLQTCVTGLQLGLLAFDVKMGTPSAGAGSDSAGNEGVDS